MPRGLFQIVQPLVKSMYQSPAEAGIVSDQSIWKLVDEFVEAIIADHDDRGQSL